MNFLQRNCTFAAVVLLAGFACARVAAQNTPLADIAVGYSYIEVIKPSGLTASGGGGSLAWNINDWLGAVGDFAVYHSTPVGPGVDAGTYMFGPRASYRHWGRFTLFAQVLIGGVRYANNGFVFSSGGGVDIALDRAGRFALRPQVEYLGFRTNGNTTQTARYSIGIAFRIRRR
jgi:hypothetical protein